MPNFEFYKTLLFILGKWCIIKIKLIVKTIQSVRAYSDGICRSTLIFSFENFRNCCIWTCFNYTWITAPSYCFLLSPSINSLRQSIGVNERSILPLFKVPPGAPPYIPCMSLEVAGKEWILEAGRSSGFKLLNCMQVT